MDLTQSQDGAVTVISIVGSLDALTAPQLAGFVDQIIANGSCNLVADLAALDYTSSAGLRVLLNSTKETRQHDGDLRLAAVQPNVYKVLDLSGFTSILKFFPTVEEAVASFNA